MSIVDLIMPKLGESIVEATILKWHKRPGDAVAMDETVLDIATDKVDSEVPSTADGIIVETLYNENDVVPIGEVIARIEEDNGADLSSQQSSSAPQHEDADVVEEVPYQPEEKKSMNNGNSGIRFYSPLVLNIAASEGISMSELEGIEGTGQDGRVSKKDIMSYLEKRKNAPARKAAESTQANPIHELPVTTSKQEYVPSVYTGNVEIVEMDRMRKMIAKHMIDSQNISAHVTSFTECDVTNLVLWREKVKKDFEKREGEKLTFTPLFLETIVKCIKKYPIINSSVDGDKIIIKKILI